MIDTTCQVVGLDAFRRRVLSLVPQVEAVGAVGLKREMVGVLEVSQRLCPVDTKRLVNSGRVDDPEIGGGIVNVYISYGGDNDVPYALIQHERLDYKHAQGKQAKFLERPLLEWTRDGPENLMRGVAGVLLRSWGL
jgi:hypothetical protein